MTRAPRAYSAHAWGPVPAPTGAVRVGSMARHVASRHDFQPVGRPAAKGELANAATSAGPRAFARVHRARAAQRRPMPTLICRAAVADIMRLPSCPSAPKYVSMAR